MDELLDTLAALDIRLRAEDGRLKCSAPAGGIPPAIRDRIAAHKTELLAHLSREHEPIRTVARNGSVPLSFSQRRLLVLEELAGVGAAYILPAVLRLRGALRQDLLSGALHSIVLRHEVLRTTLGFSDGAFQGLVVPNPGPPLRSYDLRAMEGRSRQEEIERLIDLTTTTPFDLSRDIPFRASLLTTGDQESLLVVAFHHSAADGWSIGIFQRELAAAYNARRHGLPDEPEPLQIQYADFAAWQQARFRGSYGEKRRGYWRKKLEGACHVLALPTDKPRPALQTFNGGSVNFALDGHTAGRLKELAAGAGATLFMALLAGFGVLLCRSCGQDDILVGVPMHNRLRRELEPLIGYFSDTVPVRLLLTGQPTFNELLGRVRNASIGAYENQDIPFDELVNAIRPERDLSRNPLVQVMFALQNAPLHGPRPRLDLDGLLVEAVEVEGEEKFTRLDLEMHLWESGMGLHGMLFYNSDLFVRETAEKMGGRYCRILRMMAAEPNEWIARMPWLDADEHRIITREWNATKRPYSSRATLHGQFHALAVADPAAPAIVSGGDRLSRGQLDARSDRIAGWLQRSGVTPGEMVGIFTRRSWCSIAAMLAILKAGGVYVPLDPTYPPARRDFMIEDAGVRTILTDASLRAELAAWWPGPSLAVDSDDLPEASTIPAKNDPDSLCYLIYTSGSTGTPKGVRVRHRGVINMVEAICCRLQPAEDEVWTVFHSHSFDFSVWEIWGALLSGGTLVTVDLDVARNPDDFYQLAVREGVTLLSLTPTALEQFAACHEQGCRAVPLRHLACGGESFPSALAARVLGWGIPLWNFYGPTEATVWASVHRVTPRDLQQAAIPIGRPFANMSMYILDEHGNPLPPNSPGELCIGGVGVACGYHNRPELTREKFTANPFDPEGDSRLYGLYHSGDLARFAHDGTITVLGRMDRQAKLRGFRIELGEIEHALRAVAGIGQAVAVLKEDGAGVKRIVAYLTAEGEPPTDETVKSRLRESLPEYMIPQTIVRLAELPVSANGKIDIAALPAPAENQTTRDYRAPRTETEKILAAAWSEALGRERIGVDDNLFDIGANSLLVVQVQRKLRSLFSADLGVTDFFRYPTLGALAAYLSEAENRPEGSNPAEERSAARREAMRRRQQTMKTQNTRSRNV
jgi:amino acid adenylation domain-containing protein